MEGGIYIASAVALLIVACIVHVIASTQSTKETYAQLKWGGSLTAPEWIKWGVGEMGIVEDAIDGVWKHIKETHVWKHMFTQIQGGQLFVEQNGSSRYTAKINTSNHYSKYFVEYDAHIDKHANKLLNAGMSMSTMSELLGEMSVRRNSYIVISKESIEKINNLFQVLSTCVHMKKFEDEDRLLQEIDRKNKEIQHLSSKTERAINGAWTSAYDRVRQSREKHSGLLKSVDKNTLEKIHEIDSLIENGKKDMRQLLKRQTDLENKIQLASTSINSEHSQRFKNKASLQAAESNVRSLRKRLLEVNRMIANMRTESIRNRNKHNADISRLSRNLSMVERKDDAIRNIVSKSSIKLAKLNTDKRELTSNYATVSSDKISTQSKLDDYSLRSDTLKATLKTVQEAIDSLPQLDTAESIKARAKVESELQAVTADTARLTSKIESRTGKIVDQEAVHDSLKPRIVDLKTQIDAIKQLNSGNVTKDLKGMIETNETLRAQLARMTLEPESYMASINESLATCPK